MRATRVLRGLGAVGLGLFLAAAFTPLPDVLSRRLGAAARLEAADAVVVLGASIHPDGTLSNHSLRRTIHGIRLYRRGLAPLLLFMGGPARAGHRSDAQVRDDLARELGIPVPVILTTTASTTREEAVRARALLEPRGVRRILLVTESQHLVRARALFERAGFEVLPAPSDGRSEPSDPEGRLLLTWHVVEELLARLYYRLAGYL